MNDLIERQAAIDAADCECQELRGVFGRIEEALKKLPSAQPEPQWIPCSEKQPERYGWYLCTYKDGRVNTKYWNGSGEWLDNIRRGMFELYDITSMATGEKITPEQSSVYWTDLVIAWMPLPEPYREDGVE